MSADAKAVVRWMVLNDVESVAAIAAVVPTAPHWPRFEYVRMLQVAAEDPARRGAWVALLEGRIAGFAMANQIAGVAELEAVVTAPGLVRRGIGSALVNAVAQWARRSGAGRLELEVRASNAAALALYARLKFRQDGLRCGYYRNPDEDALLLSLALEPCAG